MRSWQRWLFLRFFPTILGWEVIYIIFVSECSRIFILLRKKYENGAVKIDYFSVWRSSRSTNLAREALWPAVTRVRDQRSAKRSKITQASSATIGPSRSSSSNSSCSKARRTRSCDCWTSPVYEFESSYFSQFFSSGVKNNLDYSFTWFEKKCSFPDERSDVWSIRARLSSPLSVREYHPFKINLIRFSGGFKASSHESQTISTMNSSRARYYFHKYFIFKKSAPL